MKLHPGFVIRDEKRKKEKEEEPIEGFNDEPSLAQLVGFSFITFSLNETTAQLF